MAEHFESLETHRNTSASYSARNVYFMIIYCVCIAFIFVMPICGYNNIVRCSYFHLFLNSGIRNFYMFIWSKNIVNRLMCLQRCAFFWGGGKEGER